MLKTILVDDERPALKALEYQLKQYKEIEIVGGYIDITLAFEKMRKESIDLVFLDIEMPKMKGIEAAKKALAINSDMQIVFITAYDGYAVDAFEVDAVDYIMKPVLKRRLDRTIERIKKRHSSPLKVNDRQQVNKILCLGSFEWINNSQPVKWRTSKTKELIAYLVHHEGELIHRDKIIEDLWPDKEIEKATKLLHTSVYNIRRSLKSIGIKEGILYSHEMYRLNVPDIYCDIYEFRKIAIKKIEVGVKNIKEYKVIVESYRGDYFEANDYLWAKDDKTQISQLYIDILKEISKYYTVQRQYNQAIIYLRKILDKNYYIEEVHKCLLDIYKNTGDNILFHDHYREMKKIFNDELGVELSLI
jgi:two-component SAPR family response regulator